MINHVVVHNQPSSKLDSINLITNRYILLNRYKDLQIARKNEQFAIVDRILSEKRWISDYLHDFSRAYLIKVKQENEKIKSNSNTVNIKNFKKFIIKYSGISKKTFDNYLNVFLQDDFYVKNSNKEYFTLKTNKELVGLDNEYKVINNIQHKTINKHIPYKPSLYKKTVLLGVYSRPLLDNSEKYTKVSNFVTLEDVSNQTGYSLQYISDVCRREQISRVYGFQEIERDEYERMFNSEKNKYKVHCESQMTPQLAKINHETGEILKEAHFIKKERYFKIVGTKVPMNEVKNILSHKMSKKVEKNKNKYKTRTNTFKVIEGNLKGVYSDNINIISNNEFYSQNNSLNISDALQENDRMTTDTKSQSYKLYTVNAYNLSTAKAKLNLILWDKLINNFYFNIYTKEDYLLKYESNLLKKGNIKTISEINKSIFNKLNRIKKDVETSKVFTLIGFSVNSIFKFITTYYNVIKQNINYINSYTNKFYNFTIDNNIIKKVDYAFFILNSNINTIKNRIALIVSNNSDMNKVKNKISKYRLLFDKMIINNRNMMIGICKNS